MKTRLIWRKCWLLENKDAFWIECTDEEVIDNIQPLIVEESSLNLESIERNHGYSKINKNQNERMFSNFFLISIDCQDIMSERWVYPYSGLWNSQNPFEEIDVVDFNSLLDLNDIFKRLKIHNLNDDESIK